MTISSRSWVPHVGLCQVCHKLQDVCGGEGAPWIVEIHAPPEKKTPNEICKGSRRPPISDTVKEKAGSVQHSTPSFPPRRPPIGWGR